MLDKTLFYEALSHFENKNLPIFFNIPINRDNLNIRLIYDWTSRKPNGDFNPIMTAQLVDMNKTVNEGKYIVPDLLMDAVKENLTTSYRVYKRLNEWVKDALRRR